jgi:indole-3-glycerol phosphate synthase
MQDVAIVAEVKRRSPSRGAINPGLDAGAQAEAYARGGAAAISVLTEPDAFGGSDADLREVRRRLSIPVLRKDFHVHPVQLVEAQALGASAALLIVRALSPDDLPLLTREAGTLGLETLVEVRDEWELERALAAGAAVIGVNSRNLETLEVDPRRAERVLRLVPADRIAVAESGMRARDDVIDAARWGADAVLIGSALSAAAEPADAVRALRGVPRGGRGG